MGLFGLKSKKSSHSDSSSIRKHTLHASTASSTVKHNPDASDIVGDSPTFNPTPTAKSQPRRQDSITSETASLRNRNSTNMMKLFGGSTSKRRPSKGPSDSQSPNITQPAEYFDGGRKSTSQARTPAAEPAGSKTSTPVAETAKPGVAGLPTLGSLPTIGTPTGDGSLVNAVNKDVPGAGLNANAGPRPSDLFAGKGVQWNQIDLTARDSTANAQPPKAEDLQSFLKARRQWIPTFKTEDSVEEEESITADRLANLSFTTTGVDRSGGLMSLKDLEESHKRKAALSSQLPIVTGNNGTVFEEAGAQAGRGSISADLPPRPTAPLRNQSFRTSNFIGGGGASSAASGSGSGATANGGVNGHGAALTKSGIGSLSRKPVPKATEEDGAGPAAATTPQRDIPQRRSSMQRSRPSSDVNGSDVAPANGTSAVAANGASAAEGTPAAHAAGRASLDTATGFATPETGDAAVVENAGTGAIAVPHVSASPAGAAAPPRPPKADRTPTASRKNSQDPLHASLGAADSAAAGTSDGHTAEVGALQRVDEVASKAAPALQTQVPGTGAAAAAASSQ
ncbi:uncharacterized protein PFL1_02141 [Pseudozyma flocculosa PF-1]|uniref:Uncharacterized protein n=1 Tax=Pseudozyma flocculosa TaxID=84751 RepID=A0A5C3F355_9BASI|nr:uncharacterized protein PFL1_02141 [Pseudozyma flocculosa PF-1]EPQ30617.1 hypothetical protein PFL1_02141 [Pseudozyma flocculosa PF-1]SPO37711.1 uncharacterized protein PSFLO_03187 [Pseudozyma flocculosa]